jgi:DNA-binding NtrC family response regulator
VFFKNGMMKTIDILYIGGHFEILETVIRLINANENWNGVGVMKDEEAKEVFRNKNFSVVLLGSGIQEESEVELCAFFKKQNPNIVIVQHYGGGSGLLKSEILIALENNKN